MAKCISCGIADEHVVGGPQFEPHHVLPHRCIRALRQRVAELEARQGWQPIDTAPKDGTWIIVCDARNATQQGRWPGERTYYGPTIQAAHWGTFHPNSQGKEAWRGATGHKFSPSHWMPLPEPPTNEPGE